MLRKCTHSMQNLCDASGSRTRASRRLALCANCFACSIIPVPPPIHQVAVVPHGVSKEECNPEHVDPASCNTDLEMKAFLLQRKRQEERDRPFMFLYDSSLLARKGVMQMLEAYLSTFTAQDKVVLVVHSSGGDSETQVCALVPARALEART